MNLTRRGFLGGGAAFFMTGCRTTEWFGTPELRFGVVSDIHVTTPESTALFRDALKFFRSRGADAVMVPGDLTDWGLKSSMRYVKEAWDSVFAGTRVTPLFCTGNHDYDGWHYGDMTMEMHANGYSEDDRMTIDGNLGAEWEKIFGEPFAPIRVRTVKGYDFISAEWEDYKKFPEWMERNGARFKGDKPFFFFQHPPMKGCSWAGAGWGDGGSGKKALAGYPNAVAFLGHYHIPFNDERSVWQGEFTAFDVPSLSYACFPPGHENGEGKRDGTSKQAMTIIPARRDLRGGQGYFVSVYADKMVVERIDIEEGCVEGAPAWIVPFGPDAPQPYDLERRTAESVAPKFPAAAKLSISTRNTENRSGKWTIVLDCQFSAAVPEEGVRVFDYEIKAVPKDGSKPLVKKFVSPAYAKMAKYEPKTMRFWFDAAELPQDKDYVLEVRAYNHFGKASAPLVSPVRRTVPGLGKVNLPKKA